MNPDSSPGSPRARLALLEREEGRAGPLAEPLQRSLEGAVYPLAREQLVRVARENAAAAGLLSRLAALPERRFESLDAVALALDAASDDGAAR